MQRQEKKRFLAIGECMVELSGGLDGMFKIGFAGDTLNTAWYARTGLGQGWDVAYFTAIGDDLYSQAMRKFLNDGNIETDFVHSISGKRPGLYIIHQENGDRQFTYWRENSAARQLADDRQALNDAVDGANCIYFSGITLAILVPKRRDDLLNAIQAARKNNVLVGFDPNIRAALWPDKNELLRALRDAASVSDIVLPTFSDEVGLFADSSVEHMMARYHAAGAREVISKDGANPVCLSFDGDTSFVPVATVENIVDATGAGDSFNGAYLAARLNGESPDVAARAGSLMAANVIRHQGALIMR
jgi:2-dehydro-3-deoxygluconokinase